MVPGEVVINADDVDEFGSLVIGERAAAANHERHRPRRIQLFRVVDEYLKIPDN